MSQVLRADTRGYSVSSPDHIRSQHKYQQFSKNRLAQFRLVCANMSHFQLRWVRPRPGLEAGAGQGCAGATSLSLLSEEPGVLSSPPAASEASGCDASNKLHSVTPANLHDMTGTLHFMKPKLMNKGWFCDFIL